MKNVKIAVIPVFCLMFVSFQLSPLTADDGSWSSTFSVSGGSIYSENDDTDIVLEKELLIFDGRSTEAHFLFRNTSTEDIVLECGFPVVHRIDSHMIEGGAEIPVSKYGGGDIPALDYLETVPHPMSGDDEPMFVYPEIIPDNEYNNSREFIGPGGAADAGISFSVSCNGKAVAVDDILLERKINHDNIDLSFHFRHSLSFPAGETALVSVEYTQSLLAGNEGGAACDVYRWQYIIGTGGTWKGPIGELVFIKPSSWTGDTGNLKRIEGQESPDILVAKDWEPERDEEFVLKSVPVSMMEEFSFFFDVEDFISIWKEGLSRMVLPEKPAQSLVKKIAASSSLEESTDVFLENGMRAESGFSALSAFDGFEETSWCEGISGNGEGEFLTVELTRPTAGIIIRNGFKRMPFDDWVYRTGSFERGVRDDKSGFRDYFSMNSRVKTLSVTDLRGNVVARLELADRRDPQLFFGFFMNPGRYRFVIDDVYPGSRWEDTCIAEIGFIENNFSSVDFLFKDSFYGKLIGIRRYE